MTSNHSSVQVEAERAVIGALLLAGERIPDARAVLASEDFETVSLRVTLDALCQLDDARIPIDFISVGNTLKERGTFGAAGGHEALVELASEVTSAARLAFHCRIVAEASTLRRLMRVCEDAVVEANQVQPGAGQVEPFIDLVERSILDVSARRHSAAKLMTVAESLPDVLRSLTDESRISGLETGLCDLDELLRGMRSGELLLLAARPGEGKTAVAGQIALNVAQRGGTVLFLSLEMSRESLIERMLGNLGQIESTVMRDRRFAHADHRRSLDGAAVELGSVGQHIFIDDVGDTSLSRMRALARRCAARHGLDLIVVDYLQLMHEPGVKNRWEEVGQVSRGLKALAKERSVPVLALAQLNREAAAGERPRLHHLRESGSMEQDADAVMLLWSSEAPGDTIDLNCDVAKNRHGRRGECKLTFAKPFFRVGNVTVKSEVVFDGAPARSDWT